MKEATKLKIRTFYGNKILMRVIWDIIWIIQREALNINTSEIRTKDHVCKAEKEEIIKIILVFVLIQSIYNSIHY